MGPDRVPEGNEAQPGSPDAAFSGPICVAESERGHGPATALFVELRERLPGRECTAVSGRIEAAMATHYVARELLALGHDVR